MKKDISVKLNEARLRKLETLLPTLKRDYEAIPESATEVRTVVRNYISEVSAEYECLMNLRARGYRSEEKR